MDFASIAAALEKAPKSQRFCLVTCPVKATPQLQAYFEVSVMDMNKGIVYAGIRVIEGPDMLVHINEAIGRVADIKHTQMAAYVYTLEVAHHLNLWIKLEEAPDTLTS